MRAAFLTLGCKVNQVETQVIREQFKAAGYELVDFDEPADVYVVNTCSVTAVSDKKSRQALRRAKRRNPAAIVVATGCYPQTAPAELEAMREVDVVVGNRRKSEILDAVAEAQRSMGRVVRLRDLTHESRFEPLRATAHFEHTRAAVKIQDGCDNFCAYCIIPYARGRICSKPLDEAVEELRGLARRGFLEIVLTGIEIASYGEGGEIALVDLLEACDAALDEMGSPARLRLGSLEPRIVTPAFVARLANLRHICPQFHLSLQSGCDETLRRMNRKYDTALYREAVRLLRRHIPHTAITTDLMVGFPGETDAELEQTLLFLDEIGFAKVHVFAYSRRPGTAADRMPGQIPARVKEQRSHLVIERMERARQAFFAAQLGEVFPVLFETEVSPGVFEGVTPNYTPVRAASSEPLAGTLRPVLLTGAGADWCEGVLADKTEK